jgi:hypothetical protein
MQFFYLKNEPTTGFATGLAAGFFAAGLACINQA